MLILQAAITSNERAKLREYATECIAVTGVSAGKEENLLFYPLTGFFITHGFHFLFGFAEIVENAKAGVFPVKDEKLDCFALCFLKKIGLVTAAGEFDEAVLRAKIPADYPKTEVDKIVAQCKPLCNNNNNILSYTMALGM